MTVFFDLATTTSVPWKNGGGSTRELACWPPGAGMAHFEWRVSVATIASNGPFSVFAGIDRHIMLLDGDGVQLQGTPPAADSRTDVDIGAAPAARAAWAHALQPRWQPHAFAGDDAVDCQMLGGTSTDFNLMVRRGAWSGGLQVVNTPQALPPDGAGLCMVLQGAWEWAEDLASTDTPSAARKLAPGQGAWWVNGAAAQPGTVARAAQLRPVGAGPAVLAWVALVPAHATAADGAGAV